jgi:hypothetical protein
VDNDGVSGCWSLCLPPGGTDDRDIELNRVSVNGSESDSSSEDPSVEPMPGAKPTWRTRQLFDPNVHLTLDATGLHPNHLAISNSLDSEEEIARLLNHAQAVADSSPLFCPQGFDAATHAQQHADGNWGPNLAGILADNHLTVAQKVDVYRWARIYRPDTRTDPIHVQQVAAASTMVVACAVALAAAFGGTVYLVERFVPSSRDHCVYLPLNGTAAEALVQSLREEFPQLVNATLENMSDWYPAIRANLSEPIYRDREGRILEEVCRSAAQTLDPVLSLMVVFSLLAMQMLLQG